MIICDFDMQGLISSMNQGQSKLKTATDLGELLYSRTSPEGCRLIQDQLAALRREYDLLAARLSSTKNVIGKAKNNLSELSKAHEALNKWVETSEMELKAMSVTTKRNLNEKKIGLEKLKVTST